MRRRSCLPLLASPVVALGCATTSPPRDPAFLVYTSKDGELSTHVVHVDRPGVDHLAGIWVYDPAHQPPWLGAAGGPDACACPEVCGEASRPFQRPDAVHSGNDTCDDPVFQSFVGGTLFGAAETHSDTCMTGLNLYGGEVVEVDLLPAKWRPDAMSGPAEWCVEGGTAGEVPEPEGVCTLSGGRWLDGDEGECGVCRESYNDDTPYLRRGLLTTVSEIWSGASAEPEAQLVGQIAVTPQRCPSPEEPCGELGAFAAAFALPPDEDAPPYTPPGEPAFWVANDGRVALAVDPKATGVGADPLTVWTLSAEPRAVDVSPEGVIGVRYHADVTALLDRVCAVVCSPRWCEATFPERQCPEVLDDDQRDCTYGVERDEDDADSADDDNAADDDSADDGDPGVPPRPTTPPSGPTTAPDPRSASELGNACFAHLKAGDLATAERECALALERADNDRTRGAVLFNLGLLAEKRGDAASARTYYQRSLTARPNDTVRKRLEALGPARL